MAYTVRPTFADTNILTAAQLNILSDDVEYLYGLVSGVNIPFNSIKTTINLRSNNNQWLLRHAYKYLHHKALVTANTNDDYDIFINNGTDDIMVFTDSTARSYGPPDYTYSGYIDLEDVTTWTTGTTPGSGDDDIYQDAYAGGTTYDLYDIVLYSGKYYYSRVGSNTGNQPDISTTEWRDLGASENIWTDGVRYQMYVYTNLNSSYTFTLDYLLESDQTSL